MNDNQKKLLIKVIKELGINYDKDSKGKLMNITKKHRKSDTK